MSFFPDRPYSLCCPTVGALHERPASKSRNCPQFVHTSCINHLFGVRKELRVRALEILDLAATEIPDPGCDFVDHVVVMRHQQ